MSSVELPGIDGSNPLGFLAALGLLRIIPTASIYFFNDGSFRPGYDGINISEAELARLVLDDAEAAGDASAPWRFTYTKAPTKKQGPLEVADLKPPPGDFKRYLDDCVEDWLSGNEEAAAYAAAYGTDVAVDGKGNTKPTAFHFTAANQTFLGAVETIRAALTEEWVATSLFDGNGGRRGSNLRWDPNAERNWALMAQNPNVDGTTVDAPLEWLAFRGLPLLPSFPIGSRIVTTGVTGRGNDLAFVWPLWSVSASLDTVRTLLQVDWIGDEQGAKIRKSGERAGRGIFAVCRSSIRRTSQGFGNFGPSAIVG